MFKYLIYLAALAVSLAAGVILYGVKPAAGIAVFSGAGFVFLLIITDVIIGIKRAGKGAIYPKLLDTSVIIDGRINEIARTGFLEGTLIAPKFVLHELQLIADSADNMKRSKGRRGLDLLNELNKAGNVKVEIVDKDYPEARGVDHKLIVMAKETGAKIITNDYNLNKLAEIQGVKILNLNDLSNAVKPSFLPGEKINVKIMKEGKEKEQGIAYLPDGTMIVVDYAGKFLNKKIDVIVTNVLQTDAGRMVFAKFESGKSGGGRNQGNRPNGKKFFRKR
ncbi:MAG: PIN/TRAM domain-containing protein [Candidatus Goldiibacteriota bacterium]